MTEIAEFSISEIDVPTEERHDEQLGSKAKFWYSKPEDESWLFKYSRQNEDWSEKAAAELAEHLGLPHARVELAQCASQPGVISQSFLRSGDRLVHGNELLLELDTTYPMTGKFHTSAHTAETIATALERFKVTPWCESISPLPASFTGYDLFIGYLLFDAWIGNSDRHHENWAIVQRSEQRMLAPTYDHGSSMGRNETDERVKTRLHGKDPRVTVDSYASKCRSALFKTAQSSHAMQTSEAFLHAGQLSTKSRDYWLSKLKSTNPDSIHRIFRKIPSARISEHHREFSYRITMVNRERLLATFTGNDND